MTHEDFARGLTEALTKAFGVLTPEQFEEIVKPPLEDTYDSEE